VAEKVRSGLRASPLHRAATRPHVCRLAFWPASTNTCQSGWLRLLWLLRLLGLLGDLSDIVCRGSPNLQQVPLCIGSRIAQAHGKMRLWSSLAAPARYERSTPYGVQRSSPSPPAHQVSAMASKKGTAPCPPPLASLLSLDCTFVLYEVLGTVVSEEPDRGPRSLSKHQFNFQAFDLARHRSPARIPDLHLCTLHTFFLLVSHCTTAAQLPDHRSTVVLLSSPSNVARN
jgi:hypothetical protein